MLVLQARREIVACRVTLVRMAAQALFAVPLALLGRRETRAIVASQALLVCRDPVVPKGRMVPMASLDQLVLRVQRVTRVQLVPVVHLEISVLVVLRVMLATLAPLVCLALLVNVV